MQHRLEALARRIKALRAKKEISQEAFADVCGLHRTAMGLIERAESVPRLDTLLMISTGFGITVSELLKGIEKSGGAPHHESKRPSPGGHVAADPLAGSNQRR